MEKRAAQKTLSSPPASSVTEIFRRALRSGGEWPEKDELLDVVYWLRQVLGCALGLLWGAFGLYGFVGLALYVLVTTVVVHAYVVAYQQSDLEALGGFWELAKEGFMSAFATFVVAWIIVYSGMHAS